MTQVLQKPQFTDSLHLICNGNFCDRYTCASKKKYFDPSHMQVESWTGQFQIFFFYFKFLAYISNGADFDVRTELG